MGYPPSLPPLDSDTPPYTQRHTPALVLASPAPSPRSAVPMASSDRPPSPRPESNSGSSYRAGGSGRTPVHRPYHPNPPAHRSEWVMWVGNVPSDATLEELYRFFNMPYAPGENTTGVVSIFPISRSNCAFVNYYGQGPLEEAIERFNGKQLRPNDPWCPGFVCRVRKVDEDLKAGNKNKLKAGTPSVASSSSAASEDAPPTTPSSASGDVVAGMSNLSMSSDDQFAKTGLKSNSSGSYAFTNSSLLASHFLKRYFIPKSLTQYDVDLSVEKGVWATQKHNESILDQAYRTSKDIYLIVGVNKSGEFYGYARMAGPVKGERKVSWASHAGDFSLSVSPTTGRHNSITAEEGIASAATKSPVTNILSPASGRLQPQPAKSAPAEFGACHQLSLSMHPVGRHTHEDQPSPEFALDETAPLKAQRNAPASATTTDASVRAPGEREQPEPSKPSIPSRTDSGREETRGESFKVEWLCTKRLPFFRTRHLRNPWNHDRKVKVSRDGTELEPAVGQRLLDEMHHPQHLSRRPRPHESPVAETPGLKEKQDREKRWREEVRFGAGVHEMDFLLRWGMARVRRANGERGLLSLSYYDDSTLSINTYIHTLLRPLLPALRSLLHALLTLSSRVVAHSAKSGHTPPSLAPLFGPLVFGLGKEGAGISGVYERYLTSTTAMEHLLIAFFRAQDAETVR
ncbi:YT521-B-like domain-containing protein [Schizophyllum commune]